MAGGICGSCCCSARAGCSCTPASSCSQSESCSPCFSFRALFTKIFAIRAGFHPPYPPLESVSRYVTLEVGLAAGALMVLIGVVGLIVAVASWGAVGFGSLDPSLTMREVIPAVVLLALGSQTVFASFFISILSIDRD